MGGTDRRGSDPQRRAGGVVQIEIEYAMPIHVPMVAVHGRRRRRSIARVDAAGLIQIGPESAGQSGPICYGRGVEPTTDANLRQRLAPQKLLAVENPVTSTASPHLRGPDRQGDRSVRRRGGGSGAAARQHEDGWRHPHRLGVANHGVISPVRRRRRAVMRRHWRARSACRVLVPARPVLPTRSAASSPICA